MGPKANVPGRNGLRPGTCGNSQIRAYAASAQARPVAAPSGPAASALPAARCAAAALRAVARHAACPPPPGDAPAAVAEEVAPAVPAERGARAARADRGDPADPGARAARGGQDSADSPAVHADRAEIATPHPHVPPAIVVHRALTDAGDKRVRRLTVPEDEPRFGTVRTREDYARTAVVAVGVIVRIIVHHDAKAYARVVVWAPVRGAHVRVAVVAQETRIVVLLLDVVRNDVVVPV